MHTFEPTRDVDTSSTTTVSCGAPEPFVQPGPDQGPLWRVVGGSLLTGLVAAMAATLVVFAGSTEHVITGSALLAFAGGWAMLAVLSRRCTRRPQTWAWVPAATMAVIGAMLVVAQPDDRALDNAGWIWPPAMLVLAAWMLRRIRRGLDGRVRWPLYAVAVSLAIGSLGATFETAMRSHDRRTYGAPGERYDVGGHRLHLHCVGSGSPTVVLENGLGGTSPAWTHVVAAVRGTTRICAYDRAGQGWSDDVDAPQDGSAVAEDLHTLLAVAGVPGPYVLVGHSAGGPYVMTYASRHPDEVAGMVLLDSMSPDEFTALPGFAAEQSMMRRGLGVLPSLARLGVGRLVPASVWSDLPEPEASQVRAFAAGARGMRSMRDEQSMYPVVFAQASALTSLGDKPLVVLTASGSVREHAEWTALQEDLAARSTNHAHRVVEATHAGLLEDVSDAASSAVAVLDVVEAVRTGTPIAGR